MSFNLSFNLSFNFAPRNFVVATLGAAALSALLLPAIVSPSLAEGGVNVGTIKHEATARECSACHMAFQAAWLPKRSWEAIMNDLPNHFGEDASLPDDVRADITAYLVANAGDAKTANRWVSRIKSTDTPLRITETPGWTRAHNGEVSPSSFTSAKVKSKANCTACHAGAAKGWFEDD